MPRISERHAALLPQWRLYLRSQAKARKLTAEAKAWYSRVPATGRPSRSMERQRADNLTEMARTLVVQADEALRKAALTIGGPGTVVTVLGPASVKVHMPRTRQTPTPETIHLGAEMQSAHTTLVAEAQAYLDGLPESVRKALVLRS